MKRALLLVLAGTAVAHVLLLALAPPAPATLDRLCLEIIRPVLLAGPSALAARTQVPVAQVVTTLWATAILFLLVRATVATLRRRDARAAWRSAGAGILVILTLTLHAFLFCFGLLYLGLPIEDRLPRLAAEVATPQLDQEVMALAAVTRAARVPVRERSLAEISALVVAAENRRLAELEMPPIPATLRAKAVWPRGLLLAGGISGVTAFLPPEPIIDAAIDGALVPMLVAHEMAHMAGFAHEHEAEFFAWWALADHEEPDLRYSAWLAISMRIVHGLELVGRMRFSRALGPEVVGDMRRIRGRFTQQRIKVVADATTVVHDTYLKNMGVADGLGSYDRAAGLVLRELATRP